LSEHYRYKALKPDKFLGGMSGGDIFSLGGGQSHNFNCCFIHCILVTLQSYRKPLTQMAPLSLRVNYKLAHFCILPEKKEGHDHDNLVSYYTLDASYSLPLTHYMLKEWACASVSILLHKLQ
jgi:hypothetical protein